MKHIDLNTIIEKIDGFSSLEFIEQGGQKAVYRGKHESFGDVVAKFIIQPNERIRREIEIAVNYEIPNTARLFSTQDFEYEGLNAICVIEEYVSGINLRKEIRKNGPLTLKKAICLIETLLETAVSLESYKLVHRDIKPENIMVCPDESFKLLDFGIARFLLKSSLTPNDTRYGPYSAGYAAPEQFRNYKKEIDIRTDLFAIGIVAYEAIAGNHPFANGASDSLEVQRRTETIIPVSLLIDGDKKRELDEFIAILMSKFPSRRPPTAAHALEWFRAICLSLDIGKV
ncbi:MAG: serine/threonine-protein kinase [candidate division Zixibacteria bacterium]